MATVPLRLAVGSTGLRYSFTAIEAILGGQLVEWRDITTKPGVRACGVAGAASVIVAGVALDDIRATASSVQDGQVVDKEHALTVVAYGIVPVVFAAAATRGQALIAAAAGKVTPTGAGAAANDAVIGFCAQDSVAGGGSTVGLAFIKPSGG